MRVPVERAAVVGGLVGQFPSAVVGAVELGGIGKSVDYVMPVAIGEPTAAIGKGVLHQLCLGRI